MTTITQPHSTWLRVCKLEDIPRLGARVIQRPGDNVAVFRNAEDEIFALRDACPHKGGPLSQGIVFGRTVACPLHNQQICLQKGEAIAPDTGCTQTYPIRVDGGTVYIQLPE